MATINGLSFINFITARNMPQKSGILLRFCVFFCPQLMTGVSSFLCQLSSLTGRMNKTVQNFINKKKTV